MVSLKGSGNGINVRVYPNFVKPAFGFTYLSRNVMKGNKVDAIAFRP
jgi:hypothetical protein